jgi:MFS family permease
MSLVAGLFSVGRKRDGAFGAMGAVSAMGAASGVLLGGVLTSLLGWQWVLLVNLPIGAGVVALAIRIIPRDGRSTNVNALDLPGAATVTAALVLAVYGVAQTASHGWLSLRTLLIFAAATSLVALFLVIEQRAAHPLLALGTLHARALLAPIATSLVHATGPLATLYFLSLYFQQHLGYSPMQTGLAFLPLSVAAAVGASVASRWVGRFGTLPPMLVGLFMMALGLFLLSPLPSDASYPLQLLPGIVMVGFGVTVAGVPMTLAAVAALRPEESGLASGLLNTCQQMGAALALAVLVAVEVGTRSAGGHVLSGARNALRAGSGVLLAGAALAWLVAPRVRDRR